MAAVRHHQTAAKGGKGGRAYNNSEGFRTWRRSSATVGDGQQLSFCVVEAVYRDRTQSRKCS